MSNTPDINALFQQFMQQQQQGGNTWQNPGMTSSPTTPSNLSGGTHGFFRPNDSQMMSGMELTNYLTGDGSPQSYTNRSIKYDGGLTREMMGNTTSFLSNQMGNGFAGVDDMFNQYGSLGGLGGIQNNGVASAVYRPGGSIFGQGSNGQPANGGNGQQTMFGSTNPFNSTF